MVFGRMGVVMGVMVEYRLSGVRLSDGIDSIKIARNGLAPWCNEIHNAQCKLYM